MKPLVISAGDLVVVGWAYRGPRGGLIVTEQKPTHAPEAKEVVRLSEAAARIEELEAERDAIWNKAIEDAAWVADCGGKRVAAIAAAIRAMKHPALARSSLNQDGGKP